VGKFPEQDFELPVINFEYSTFSFTEVAIAVGLGEAKK